MALVKRFSREDLLRAFDLLARAENDIRTGRAAALSPRDGAAAVDSPAQAGADRGSDRGHCAARRHPLRHRGPRPPAPEARPAGKDPGDGERGRLAGCRACRAARRARRSKPVPAAAPAERCARRVDGASGVSRTEGNFKDAFLAEIRKGKPVLYNMCVAQAQKIEVNGDRCRVHVLGRVSARCATSSSRIARGSNRWRSRPRGRRIAVAAVQLEAAPAAGRRRSPATAGPEGRAPPAGAGRAGRPGDARSVPGGNTGCRRDVEVQGSRFKVQGSNPSLESRTLEP